jgi:hypothetical protein
VGAGTGSDYQKKCILNFSMQPNDTGQTTKYFALPSLYQRSGICTAFAGFFVDRDDLAHALTCADELTLLSCGFCNRAMRNFLMYWAALMPYVMYAVNANKS